MMVGHLRRATAGRAIGRFLAMLAVLLPVLFGPVVHAAIMQAGNGMDMPGMTMPEQGTSGEIKLCGMDLSGSHQGEPADAPKHHPGYDCAICPLCAALAHPAIAWAPVAFVPPPKVVATVSPQLPVRARVPPVTDLRISYPRGPPISI